MKRIFNQRGAIGAVEIALVIVLVAAGGFVAWRITQADKTVNDTAVNTQTATAPTNSDKKKDETPKAETVTLSADGYSFKAPKGWQEESNKPPFGRNFTDNKGNIVHVMVDPGEAEVGTDFVWIATSDGTGIDVTSKSSACASGSQTYKGVKYECDTSTNFTYVLVSAENSNTGLKVGSKYYAITFINNESGSADTKVFEEILATFTAK